MCKLDAHGVDWVNICKRVAYELELGVYVLRLVILVAWYQHRMDLDGIGSRSDTGSGGSLISIQNGSRYNIGSESGTGSRSNYPRYEDH